MKEELLTDAVLREFLLGTLADEEHEHIESLFLTDPQAKERVLLAEQDLIEDYLEKSLNKADSERFLALYAQTEEQRQKLRITKSIKDWAMTERQVPQATPVSLSLWTRLTRLHFKPVFLVPIAVMVVIGIVLAVVWLNSRRQESKSIELELAQLNAATSLRETPPQMHSLELRPVAVRTAESRIELDLRSGTRIFEFRLPWIQKERFPTYQAKVRHLTADKSFIINNLQPENTGDYIVRLRFPSHLLQRGYYVIELTGLTADGKPSLTEEYTFSVEAGL